MIFRLTTILVFSLIFDQNWSWPVSSHPSDTRSQFLVLHDDGGYRYGYDTGEGSTAQQFSDSSNQVFGQYSYKNDLGQIVSLKYVAGPQGFVPLEFENKSLQPSGNNAATENKNDKTTVASHSEAENQTSTNSSEFIINMEEDTENPVQNNNSDSDSDKLDNPPTTEETTDIATTTESADSEQTTSDPVSSTADSIQQTSTSVHKNIQSQSEDSDGNHVSYVAGVQNAFIPSAQSFVRTSQAHPDQSSFHYWSVPFGRSPDDPSYSFEYSTPLHSRQEIADAKGNVYGRYSFTNEAGDNDLWYVAGSSTGFLPVGGSLLPSLGLPQTKQNNDIFDKINSPDKKVLDVSAQDVSKSTTEEDKSESEDSLEEKDELVSAEEKNSGQHNKTNVSHESSEKVEKLDTESIITEVPDKNLETNTVHVDSGAPSRDLFRNFYKTWQKKDFPVLKADQSIAPSVVHLFLPSSNGNEGEFGYIFHTL